MFFSRRAFLGQVPLGQKITSGTSTYVAQELCKALEAETKEPGKYTKKIEDLWGEVKGVQWMVDEVNYWLDKWCKKYQPLLQAISPPPVKIYPSQLPPAVPPAAPPSPPVATPGSLPTTMPTQDITKQSWIRTYPTPVATPGKGQQWITKCYECGPGNYQRLLPTDAQAKGCKETLTSNCEAPKSPSPVGICPAGQFWDGRQCRGSIAPGLNVFSQAMKFAPSGFSPLMETPGGAMPYTAFGGLSGRRIPISNP